MCRLRPAFALVSTLIVAVLALSAPLSTARAQVARALPLPAGDEGTRALLIQARMTGDHLDAFVDGYRLPGLPAPGGDGFGAAWSTPPRLVDAGSPWAPLPPPARWVHSTIYDPFRDRLIVFGGQGYAGSTNEVWAFYLSGIPHWVKLSPAGTAPSARAFHTAIFDSLADRMIVFGGNDGARKNDVWQLTFSGVPTWSPLAPAGTPPAAREWHTAVHDRLRNRMIVYGGTNGAANLDDSWALSLGASPAWSNLAPTGTPPGGRVAHAALYDAGTDRMIVFSGLNGASAVNNEIWALSLAGTPAWTKLTPTGTPPSARYGASGRYDAPRRRALFFGGGVGAPNTNETWALSLTGTPAWTLLPAPNPPQGRQFHTSAYDPFGDRLLIFGGSSGPLLSDTWALPLSSPGAAWIPLTSTRRRGHGAILDEARQRMVVFGGENATQLADVWALGVEPGGTWERLNPSGAAPSARALHSALYDDRRDRMIVFGGRGGPAVNDLWELTFSGTLEWRAIQPAGTPPSARFDHVAIFDPVGYRMIVFGGTNGTNAFNDAWTLDLAGTPTWRALSPTGVKPSARAGAQAIYDPARDRLVVFGGYTGNFTPLDDAYQLTLGTTPAWTQLAPTGTKPAARLAGAAVYDPVRDRMVIASGTDYVNYFDDTWELKFPSGAGAPSWFRLLGPGTGPTARSDHKAIYDALSDRLVVFGGFNLAGVLHDTWSMNFVTAVGVPGDGLLAAGDEATLALAGANPSRDGSRLAFTLPRAGVVELGVYDASGRRVRSLASGAREAGRHAATWDARDAAGRRVPAGVYFARLSGVGAAAVKLVVLP